jgi:hypothetical protein
MASLERVSVPWESLVRLAVANLTLAALDKRGGDRGPVAGALKAGAMSRPTSTPLALSLLPGKAVGNGEGSGEGSGESSGKGSGESSGEGSGASGAWFTADAVCLFLEERWATLCGDKNPTKPWAATVTRALQVSEW